MNKKTIVIEIIKNLQKQMEDEEFIEGVLKQAEMLTNCPEMRENAKTLMRKLFNKQKDKKTLKEFIKFSTEPSSNALLSITLVAVISHSIKEASLLANDILLTEAFQVFFTSKEKDNTRH